MNLISKGAGLLRSFTVAFKYRYQSIFITQEGSHIKIRKTIRCKSNTNNTN